MASIKVLDKAIRGPCMNAYELKHQFEFVLPRRWAGKPPNSKPPYATAEEIKLIHYGVKKYQTSQMHPRQLEMNPRIIHLSAHTATSLTIIYQKSYHQTGKMSLWSCYERRARTMTRTITDPLLTCVSCGISSDIIKSPKMYHGNDQCTLYIIFNRHSAGKDRGTPSCFNSKQTLSDIYRMTHKQISFSGSTKLFDEIRHKSRIE